MQLSRQNYGELVYSLTGFWLPQIRNTYERVQTTHRRRSYRDLCDETIIKRCHDYEDIIREISDNVNFKLQTEMMLNACVSAKESE